jgi:diaminopropionate ammonia-lyase
MIFENTLSNTPSVRRFISSADRPLAMLQQCPAYASTPMQNEPGLAAELEIGQLHVKDESKRMRLGSFKALGGSFAVAQMISDAGDGCNLEDDKAKHVAANMTFVTASAGNHGLSVAAGARVFGAKAVIVLASTVPEGFADRIRSLDAKVIWVDGNYEDSVAFARQAADDNDWLLLADGTWEGYVDRPAMVMEGYTVLAEECRVEFEAMGNWPSHVLLQAGVGGFAAAISAHIRDFWAHQPEIVIVEPEFAPCLINSVRGGDMTRGDGEVSSMGRLDCKDASLIAFEALRQDANTFITVTESEAKQVVETYVKYGYQTTESGAASLAAISHLNLTSESRCLVVTTEGVD